MIRVGTGRVLVPLLSVLLSLGFLHKTHAAGAIVPVTGPFVFEVEDYNWSFGNPTGEGVVVAANGDVYRYADPGDWRDRVPETKRALPPGLELPIAQNALAKKFRTRTLIGHVPVDELKSQILVVVPASQAQLVQVRPLPPDTSVRTYLAYTFDIKSRTYRAVKLRQTSGNGLMRSNSQAGDQLAAWLDRITVPDRLSASCGGGVVMGTTISRDGTVERWWSWPRGTEPIRAFPKPQKIALAQADIEPLFARADALDPSMFLKPSGDRVCLVAMTLHGVPSDALSISAQERKLLNKAPTEIDALFDDISALAGRTFAGKDAEPSRN